MYRGSSSAVPSDILNSLTRRQILLYSVLVFTFSFVVLVLLLHPTTDHADIRENTRQYPKDRLASSYNIQSHREQDRIFRDNIASSTNDHKTGGRAINEIIESYEKTPLDNNNNNNNNNNMNRDIKHPRVSPEDNTNNEIMKQQLPHVAEATIAHHHDNGGAASSTNVGDTANANGINALPVDMIDLSYKVSPTSSLNEHTLFPCLISHFHSNLNAFLSSNKKDHDKINPAISDGRSEKQTIEYIHRAVHTGDVCADPTVDDQFSLIASAAEDFTVLLKPKLFVDVTSSYFPIEKSVAFHIASRNPSVATILVRPPMTSADDYNDNSRYGSAYVSGLKVDECLSASSSNLFVASGEAPIRGGRYFDCLQVLTDYSSIVNSQLPFEFEESLGYVLCRCNITALPRVMPETSYFAYWETTASLLAASIGAYTAKYGGDSDAGGSCQVDIDVTLGVKSIYTTRIRNGFVVVRRSNTTDLTTKSGHISASHLKEMPLYDSSKMQLLDLTLKIGSDSQSDVYVVSGGSLTNANSSGSGLGSAAAKRAAGFYVTSDAGEDAPATISTTNSSANDAVLASAVQTENVTSPTRRRLGAYTFTTSYNKKLNYVSGGSSATWELADSFLASIELPEEISALLADIDSADPNTHPKVSGSSAATTYDANKVVVRKEQRAQQQSLQEREFESYRIWLTALLLGGDREPGSGNPFHLILDSKLVYIFGKHATLLSIKISRALTKKQTSTLLVSVLTDSRSAEPHLLLNDLMNTKNNVVCNIDITLATVAALLASPERSDVSIVQSDVVVRLMSLSIMSSDMYSLGGDSIVESPGSCGLQMFEESLAALLLASRNSFVEMPSTIAMERLLESLLPAKAACALLFHDRYNQAESVIVKATETIKFGAYVKIKQLFLADRQSKNNCGAYDIYHVKIDYLLPSSSKYSPDRNGGGGVLASRGSDNGVSIYTLLHLNVVRSQKKKLLRLHMELPLWSISSADDISPWSTFVKMSESLPLSAEPPAPVPTSRDISLWHITADTVHLSGGSFVGRGGSKANPSGAAKNSVGISSGAEDVSGEKKRSRLLFSTLAQELGRSRAEACGGTFSFVEHNSGYGFVSTLLARAFPNATIVSLERDYKKVDLHVRLLDRLGVLNNAVCNKASTDDSSIYKNIYESPELFRFQLISRGLLESFSSADSLEDWGVDVGAALSSALTSFLVVPSASQVSLAMASFFGSQSLLYGSYYSNTVGSRHSSNSKVSRILGPFRDVGAALYGGSATSASPVDKVVSFALENLSRNYRLSSHPTMEFADFETLFLLGNSKVKAGSTQLSFSKMTLSVNKNGVTEGVRIPMIRSDIANMTRRVHHHYDYAKDGHSRTYTMRVFANESVASEVAATSGAAGSLSAMYTALSPEGVRYSTSALLDSNIAHAALLPAGSHVNRNGILTVYLYRDKDSFPIPYISLHGVTLISALRLGLDMALRDRLFQSFLKLPLYEDMAPWNVILAGQRLDYIDYDTRDVVFDGDVPKAYLIMTVLMNYKRTVEDFKRCGTKASTVYGLPYVSDCVGGGLIKTFTCPDMKMPVPCGDGICHSDYISCLRSLSNEAEKIITSAAPSGSYNVYNSNKNNNNGLSNNDLAFGTGISEAMKKNIGMISEKGFSVFNT